MGPGSEIVDIRIRNHFEGGRLLTFIDSWPWPNWQCDRSIWRDILLLKPTRLRDLRAMLRILPRSYTFRVVGLSKGTL